MSLTQWNNPQQASNIYGAAGIGGSFIQGVSKPTSTGGQALGGALSGAAMGAGLGPIGMGVGAVAGGAMGLMRAQKEKEAEREAQRMVTNARQRVLSNNAKAVTAEFSNDNVKTSGYSYAKGGYLKYANGGYLVEDGEVMYSGEQPATNNNGKASQIAPGTYKFKGDTHKADSGGIGVKGGKSSFVDGTGIPMQSGFVFSNKLKTDPKPFLNFKKSFL